MTERSANRRLFVWEWFLWVTLAETAGFSVAAATGSIASFAGTDPWIVYGLLVSAGAVEGVLLGLGQIVAFRRSGVRISIPAWVAATAVGAAAAWSLGLLPGTLALDWSDNLTIGLVIALAVLLLLSIPVLQFFVLRRYRRGAWRWIPINAAAWGIAILWTFAPSPFIDESTSITVLFGVFAAAGLLMAVTVATLTGVWARKLIVPDAGELQRAVSLPAE